MCHSPTQTCTQEEMNKKFSELMKEMEDNIIKIENK